MRNYILTVIALLLLYTAWKGFEFYINEQRRNEEFLMQKKQMERDLQHDSIEREKDRELQREIMKSKENGNPK